MKTLLLFTLVIGCAIARPGGYTFIGGLYPELGEQDYSQAAKAAGKIAWDQFYESEADLADGFRGVRKTSDYIPSFYGQLANPHPLVEKERLPTQVRPARGALVYAGQPQPVQAPLSSQHSAADHGNVQSFFPGGYHKQFQQHA